MPAWDEIKTDSRRFALGSATNTNPAVVWDSQYTDWQTLSPEHQKANLKIAWSVAKAYEKYNAARIRMRNHRTQYKRDLETGRVVMVRGNNGKFIKATEKADSHLTVDLAIKDRFVDSVHIYTHDDDNGIPLRISLRSERVLTRPDDSLSPVLFRRCVPRNRPRTLNAELILQGKPPRPSPPSSRREKKRAARRRRTVQTQT